MKLASVLCVGRMKRKENEYLMIRRAFWNNVANKAMTFPGEWVFPGGEYGEDNSMMATAEREFREELNYLGVINFNGLL